MAAAAVMFFGIPIVASEYARGSVPSTTRSALFAMVPVVVVMVVAAGDASGGEERGAMRFLVPSLVGIGGLLLLLPMQFSGSVRGRFLLAAVGASVILVGLASVWLHRLLRGLGICGGDCDRGYCQCYFFAGLERCSGRDGVAYG